MNKIANIETKIYIVQYKNCANFRLKYGQIWLIWANLQGLIRKFALMLHWNVYIFLQISVSLRSYFPYLHNKKFKKIYCDRICVLKILWDKYLFQIQRFVSNLFDEMSNNYCPTLATMMFNTDDTDRRHIFSSFFWFWLRLSLKTMRKALNGHKM